jgi:hypothetical protein
MAGGLFERTRELFTRVRFETAGAIDLRGLRAAGPTWVSIQAQANRCEHVQVPPAPTGYRYDELSNSYVPDHPPGYAPAYPLFGPSDYRGG